MQEHLSCKTMPLGVYALWSCHSGNCLNKDNSLIHYIVASVFKKKRRKNARWQRYVSCHFGWALESQTLLVFFKFLKLWLIMNKTFFPCLLLNNYFKKEFTCIHLRKNCLRIEKKKSDSQNTLVMIYFVPNLIFNALKLSLQLIRKYLSSKE